MTIVTARKVIEGAYRKNGAFDNGTLPSEDAAVGLEVLNTMIDAWAVSRLYAYNTVMVTASLPPAAGTRTIGPGAQINIEWPMRIEGGSFTRNGNIDYPLKVVDVTQYNAIQVKTISSTWPEVVYYDKSLPTGTLFFYPVPAANLELHLAVQQRFSQFASLDAEYHFPPGYKRGLIYCLAVEMADDIGRQPSRLAVQQAANFTRTLKRANAETPMLSVDLGARRRFNILGNS